MDRATLEASKRQALGSRASRRLRQQGLLPAVLYGHRREPVHLSIAARDFERILQDGARMVDLEIGGTTETALVKDVQYDAMGDRLLHIDLARVDLDERVTVTVPVELHGLAAGVASGGTLDHVIQDVEVECLATEIPERIRVEIAHLDIGEIVHVRDLAVPEGVKVLQDPDAPVVTIHPPVAEAAVQVEELEAATEEPEVLSGRREKETQADEEGQRE